MRTRRPIALLPFVIVSGAITGWCAWSLVPDALAQGEIPLREEVYAADWRERPFAIDDARRLPVPFEFGDFDMQMDVELGDGVILDLLVRLVEPRVLGSELLPFHGRFSVLRLSADRKGEPWLDREAALLGDRDAGGVDLAPGVTATVWLHGRGRWLHANVAGRWLPWFPAEDAFGSFVVAARGGTAVVKSVRIAPVPAANGWLWQPWAWLSMGALLGLLVGAAGLWLGGSLLATGGVLLVSGPLAVTAWFASGHWPLPLQQPRIENLFALLVGCGCLALGARWWRLLPAAAGIAVLVLFAPPPFDRPALDRVFGPAAGSALSEAALQQVRGEFMIHDAGPEEHRVFLLGGQLLYNRRLPEEHLEILLAGDLAAALGVARPGRVDVPCLPTVDGHLAQQWEMFSRFYRGYRPDVLVLGLPADEGVEDPRTGKPRSYPSTVERVLAEAREWCAASGVKLVLFADGRAPGPLLAVFDKAHAAGLPLVIAGADDEPAAISDALTAVIAPLMMP